MQKLRSKKYIAIISIISVVIAIVGIVRIGNIDFDKGKVKISAAFINSINTSLSANVYDTIITNENVVSKGYDKISYFITYTLKTDEDIEERNVIIEASLDESEKFASFKNITGKNISSTLAEDRKSITIKVEKAKVNVENKLELIMVIEGAPNEYKVTPNIKIKEISEKNYTNLDTKTIEIKNNSLSGNVKDTNGMNVSNIEIALIQNGETIKKTYTDENGNYTFSDIAEGEYTVIIDEEIYEDVNQSNINIKDSTTLDITVKSVDPYNIEIRKLITEINIMNSGKTTTYKYGNLDKVQQSFKNVKNMTGTVKYKITIQNIGKKSGIITTVKDELPEGLTFDQGKNSSWELVNGILYNRSLEGITLNAGEVREESLILDFEKTNEARTYVNKVTAKGEIYEKIVFILNGKTYKEDTVLEGEKIKEVKIDNKNFSGWYTDLNFTNKYNFNNEVTKDLVLYGKTKQTHKVTFNDKNPETGKETTWDEQEIVEGEPAQEPKEPEHEGYDFDCWQDESGNRWNFRNPIERDMTLTTCYNKKEYKIEFYNYENNVEKELIVKYKETINTDEVPILLEEAGYVFKGWYELLSPLSFDFTTLITRNIKLYPKHEIIDNVVIFDDEDRITTVRVNYGDTVSPVVALGKEGHTFKYWSLQRNGDTSFDFNTQITKPTTLYAVYQINKYNVTFKDKNPQTNEETTWDNQQIEHGKTAQEPEEPEHEGYDFECWKDEEGNVWNFDTPITKDVTLTTCYRKKTYTVKFMNNGDLYETQTVKYKEKVLRPEEDPSKEHNIFLGWTLNNELYSFDTLVTSDITLYSSYEEVVAPTITHEPTNWTNDKVTVTIKADGHDDYKYQYKVDDGNYKDYEAPFTIDYNCTIVAKSIKNDVYSVTTSHDITNIDKVKPKINSVDVSNITKTSFDLDITSIDYESGMKEINIYKDDALETTIVYNDKYNEEKNSTYTFNNLGEGQEYKVKVVAKDVAGNISDAWEQTVETTIRIVARIIGRENSLFDDESLYENFSSLELAIKACPTNQCTIQMVLDTNESVEVLDGQDITLDINGRTITGVRDTYTISNSGDFTIVDNAEIPGSIVNTTGVALKNETTGTLTLGEIEDELVVSKTTPYINGGTFGVVNEYIDENNKGRFNFYDGMIAGNIAIEGEVNDKPYLYNANVVTDGDNRQIATLAVLEDAEARIVRTGVYYTQLNGAIEDTYNGTLSEESTTQTTLMQGFKTLGEVGFTYNSENNTLTSDTGTIAIAYTTIDLTQYDKDQILVIYHEGDISGSTIIVREEDSKGTQLNNTTTPYNGSSTYSLSKGKKYYVELIHKTTNSDLQFVITGINLVPVNPFEVNENTEFKTLTSNYGFEYDPTTRTLKSNNQYTYTSTAFSYIEVDLTNATEDKEVIINASLDTLYGYNVGNIVINENNSKLTSYSSSALAYMTVRGLGYQTFAGPYNYTKTLKKGKKYYIQFYYFKSYDNYTKEQYEDNNSKDQFIINSIDVVSASNNIKEIDLSQNLMTNYRGFTQYYSYDNSYMTPTSVPQEKFDSYIKVDLTDSETDQILNLNLKLGSSSYRSNNIYITSNNKDVNTSVLTSNPSNTLLSYNSQYSTYYVNGSYPYYGYNDYKYILAKGNIYYVHFTDYNINNSSQYAYSYFKNAKLIPVTESLVNIGTLPHLKGTIDDSNKPSEGDGSTTENTYYITDDGTADSNFRFIGKNTKNYVKFNNELWRVIGIFETTDSEGITAKRIKIIRNDSFESTLKVNLGWDTSSQDITNGFNHGYGVNEWSQAKLMKLLNNGYEENKGQNKIGETVTVNNSLYWNKGKGTCYKAFDNETADCDFTAIGLNDDAKEMIETIVWNTGALPYDVSQLTPYQYYTYERGTKDGKTDFVNSTNDPTIDTLPRYTTWTGKVALPYVSDYMMAASDGMGNKRTTCMSSNSYTYGDCVSNNNWMVEFLKNNSTNSISGYLYTLNPVSGGSFPAFIAPITVTPSIMPAGAATSGYIRPTVYLNTKVKITDGDGTSDDPFILEQDTEDNTTIYYGLVPELIEDDEEKEPEEETEIAEEPETNDYTLVKNSDTYGFTFDSANKTFINQNSGIAYSKAISYIKIDLRNESIDMNIDINYIVSKSDTTSTAFIHLMEDELRKIDYDDSSYSGNGYNAEDRILFTYNSNESNVITKTLEKGKVYYLQFAYYKKNNTTVSDSNEDKFSISINYSKASDGVDKFTRWDGVTSTLNKEADTVQILRNLSLNSSLVIDKSRNMILDLNGYTITNTVEDYVINNSGYLKIVDSKYSELQDEAQQNQEESLGTIYSTTFDVINNDKDAYLDIAEGVISYRKVNSMLDDTGYGIINNGKLRLGKNASVDQTILNDRYGDILNGDAVGLTVLTQSIVDTEIKGYNFSKLTNNNNVQLTLNSVSGEIVSNSTEKTIINSSDISLSAAHIIEINKSNISNISNLSSTTTYNISIDSSIVESEVNIGSSSTYSGSLINISNSTAEAFTLSNAANLTIDTTVLNSDKDFEVGNNGKLIIRNCDFPNISIVNNGSTTLENNSVINNINNKKNTTLNDSTVKGDLTNSYSSYMYITNMSIYGNLTNNANTRGTSGTIVSNSGYVTIDTSTFYDGMIYNAGLIVADSLIMNTTDSTLKNVSAIYNTGSLTIKNNLEIENYNIGIENDKPSNNWGSLTIESQENLESNSITISNCDTGISNRTGTIKIATQENVEENNIAISNCNTGISSSGGSITIGVNDENIKSDIVIDGKNTGLYATASTELYYYDGILKGITDNALYARITGNPENYDIYVSNSDDRDTVSLVRVEDKEYVAQINETKYKDLASAFESAPNDNSETEIKIIKDIYTLYESYIDETKNIKLNFNNHKINYYKDSSLIVNDGTLQLFNDENTEISNKLYGKTFVVNNGTLNYDNINIHSLFAESKVIQNNDTMNYNSGNIQSGKTTPISEYESEFIENNYLLNINGGSFNGAMRYVVDASSSDSTTNISSGTFAKASTGILSNGKLTVTDGIFENLSTIFNVESDGIASITNGNYNENNKFVINSGNTEISSVNADSTLTTNNNDGILKVYNSTFIGGSTSTSTGGEITLDHCTITSTGNMITATDTDLTINGGTYTWEGVNNSKGLSFSDTGNLNISGASFKANNVYGSNASAIYLAGSTTMTISDSNVTSKVLAIEAITTGDINIISGTYKADSTASVPAIKNTGKNTITVGKKGDVNDDGSLNLSITDPSISANGTGIKVGASSTFNFYDGIFTAPTPISGSVNEVEDGYAIYEDKNESNINQKYLKIMAVAKNLTTEQEYNDLSIAIEEADNNDIIQIIDNIVTSTNSKTVTVAEEKVVTIDINGYQVTSNNAFIDNKGDLTLKDSKYPTGYIYSQNESLVINNSGTMNINNIQIQDISAGNVIKNNSNSNLTIDSVHLYNLDGITIDNRGELTINETKVNANNTAIKNTGTVNSSGSTYTYYSNRQPTNTIQLIYNNGKFTSTSDHFNNTNSYISTRQNMEISNSTIKSSVNISDNFTSTKNSIHGTLNVNDNAEVTITGGSEYSTDYFVSLNSNYATVEVNDITISTGKGIYIHGSHNEVTLNDITFDRNLSSTLDINDKASNNTITLNSPIIRSTLGSYCKSKDSRYDNEINIDGVASGSHSICLGGFDVNVTDSNFYLSTIYGRSITINSSRVDYIRGINVEVNSSRVNYIRGINVEVNSSNVESSIISKTAVVNGDSTVRTIQSDDVTVNSGTVTTITALKTATIGVKGDKQDNEELNVSIDNPRINEITSPTFKFYDGIVNSFTTRPVEVEDGYNVKISDEGHYLVKNSKYIKNITTDTEYDNINIAIEKAKNNDVLQLTEGALIYEDHGDTAIISNDKKITIDLNGKRLYIPNTPFINNGTLDITDDSSKTQGIIDSDSIIENNGTLNFNKGTVSINNNKKLNVNGGVVNNITNSSDGTVNSTSGKIENIKSSGSVIISGGNIDNITSDTGTVNLSEGTVTNMTSDGSTIISGGIVTSLTNNGTMTMSNGTIGNLSNTSSVTVDDGILSLSSNSGTMTINNIENLSGKISNTGEINIKKATVSINQITNNGIMNLGNTNGSISTISNNKKFNIDNSNLSISSNIINNNGILTINNSTISDSNITNYNGGTLNIKGTSNTTQVDNQGILNIGEKGDPVSITNPTIKGVDYAVTNSGTFNFYDGRLIGNTAPNTGTISEVEPGYKLSVIDDVETSTKQGYLVIITDDERVAMANGINFADLQTAINSVRDGIESNIVIYKNIELTEDIIVPEGKIINLYLNNHTITYGSYQFIKNGTLNIIDSQPPEGIFASIINMISEALNININNGKNIIIYKMQDGSKLNTENVYNLYRMSDNDYKLVNMQREEEVGRYKEGNKENNMVPISGRLYINNLTSGIYKLVDNKGNEIEFVIAEDGTINGNIIENINSKGKVVATAVAYLIFTIQTGMSRFKYLIYIILIITLSLLIYIALRKVKNYKK